MSDPETIAHLIARALNAYEALATLGEEIEDEWTYVTDLAAAWRSRLAEVVAARGAEPAPAGAGAAVDRISAEVALIDDPHRAIDWLSTLPQVVLVALGEGL